MWCVYLICEVRLSILPLMLKLIVLFEMNQFFLYLQIIISFNRLEFAYLGYLGVDTVIKTSLLILHASANSLLRAINPNNLFFL